RRDRSPMEAYFAQPNTAQAAPAVIVIHEIFGLNDNIRSIARRFAEQSYVALAVDLFSGGLRPLCLLRVMGGLMLSPLNNSGVEDLRGAIGWLKGRPEVDKDRIGAIGFCMGGGYALALACLEDDIRASSVFYGMIRVHSLPLPKHVPLSEAIRKRTSPRSMRSSLKKR